LDGLDALLATVQMPSGFPVATVALNGAKKRPPIWPLRSLLLPMMTWLQSWINSVPIPPPPLPKRMLPSLPRPPRCKGVKNFRQNS